MRTTSKIAECSHLELSTKDKGLQLNEGLSRLWLQSTFYA